MLPHMSATQWTVLALAAVLVFWMVGAYNRLVALRNGIGAAWQQCEAALKLRAAVLPPLLEALRQPLGGEEAAIDALQTAHAQAAQTAATLSARPVAAQAALAWVQAEAALASRASRVLALMDQQPAARDDPAVAALLRSWRESTDQLGFARRLYDAAAQTYNAAALQRPTRWLARVYGFGLAGRVEG